MSITERNVSEIEFFTNSSFQILPPENRGIDTLRVKLSNLLFEHVRNELPRLQNDLDNALDMAEKELELLGKPRATVAECRAFLGDMSMKFYELCRAGVNGHYEDDWFETGKKIGGEIPKQRIRALVQGENRSFEEDIRKRGHKYHLHFQDGMDPQPYAGLKILTEDQALQWVKETLRRCRGKELLGNINSNVIAELFWEQSEVWEEKAKKHIDTVSDHCTQFVSALMDNIASKNIRDRIW